MISVTKTFGLTNGVGPYYCEWINSNSTPGVFLPAPSTVASTITGTIQFQDSVALLAALIQLRVVDQEGCTEIINVTIEDPCPTFGIDPIQMNVPFDLSVTPYGGIGPYTYQWQYNTALFTATGDTTNILSLSLTAPTTTPYTAVSVTVTDASGCEQVGDYVLNFCPPHIDNMAVNTWCTSTDTTENAGIFLQTDICAGYVIDWNTIQFTNVPAGMTVTQIADNNISITTDITTLGGPGIYSFNVTVNSTVGSISNTATIWVYVPDCGSFTGMVGGAYAQYLSCPVVIGDTITVDLNNLVHSSSPIDWTSFDWQPFPGQFEVSQFVLDSWSGTASVNPAHILTYTVTATNNSTDVLTFNISNDDGDIVAVYLTFIFECLQPPIAQADDICATCCDSTPYIDITTNDTPPFDPSTVTIVSNPVHGSVVVAPDGTISYTAECGYAGPDQFTYTVTDPISGNTSNEAVVSITVICAGTPVTIAACS